ncbi:MAG: DedA family protein [Myxococcota bacterium]
MVPTAAGLYVPATAARPGEEGRALIRDLLQNISGYPGLFLACAVSGILVPLPEDFALLYAGMRIATGEFAWFPVIPLAVAGVLLRDVISFSIGRLGGEWLLARPWGRRLFGGDKRIAQARAFVETHGDKAIFLGRFIVGFRSPVFMVGGAMGLSRRRFVIWDGVGLLVAVPLTVWLGYAFGQPIVDATYWLLQRARVLVGVAFVAGIAWMWWRRGLGEQPVD